MPRQAFFGVYDGHGGVDAAKFVEAQLPFLVGSQPAFAANVGVRVSCIVR
jgi:serine/threonine protein phosphatase PrpC